jgi:tetratricopeptide (TPR) repeat protein
VDEAIACWRRALAADPKHAPAHYNLGNTLKAQREVEQAMACYRRAIAADPKFAPAHTNLGLALADKGEWGEAIASYRRAIAADPKLAQAHTNLGLALKAKGEVGEAMACYRRAIAADPKFAPAHYNLGNALRAQVEEAIACYRQAVDLKPDYAEAHCNLGHALRHQGQFHAALKALRRGHQLGSSRPRWRYPSAAWVRHCPRLVALERRLPGVLAGRDRPAEGEALALAEVCRHPSRRLYASAARLCAAAFAARPALAADLTTASRYNAACAAALAAAGQGSDAPSDGKERSRLRAQALAWLRADLVAWATLAEKTAPQARQEVQRTLSHWRKDPDLAGVREPAVLAGLPQPERAAWRKLWAEVADLLKGAGAGKR